MTKLVDNLYSRNDFLSGTKQSSFCNTSEELESLGMDSETVVHNGGCHCRKVRWRVQAPTSVVASDCNCSDCFMRANTHFIVPAERWSRNYIQTRLQSEATTSSSTTASEAEPKELLETIVTNPPLEKSSNSNKIPTRVVEDSEYTQPFRSLQICVGEEDRIATRASRPFDGIYFLSGTKQSSFCNTSETLESLGMDSETVVHNGGCHCRKVRWRVQAPTSIVAWDCNCSDCFMRANTHFIVPAERFELLGDSEQFLTTYTFGTHTAKHTFCKVCGITSFYFPRSNPDGVAITFRCVDPGTLSHVEIKNFDGRNWESSHAKTGIASLSKGQNSAS
nr:centromere protein v [Quercus suber]